jgi:hypothetical protein
MHDEFRLRVQVPKPKELLHALKDLELDEEVRRDIGRLAVTHEQDHVMMYADSLSAAQRARAIVEEAMSEHGIDGQIELLRWHPVEERWEDVSVVLPANDAEQETERRRRDQTEDAESLAAGVPEWEVRVTLPTHHDARGFAKRLQSEGIPVNQNWRHLFIGANDEDQAAALAERVRSEAPAGSEVVADGNGMLIWQQMHPFAAFGGIAN